MVEVFLVIFNAFTIVFVLPGLGLLLFFEKTPIGKKFMDLLYAAAFSRKWWYALFLFTPSPFIGCFDSCGSVLLPFVPGNFWPLMWPGLVSPFVWLWHLAFMLPFGFVVVVSQKALNRNYANAFNRGLVFKIVSGIYFISMYLFWYNIPIEIVRKLLGGFLL